MGESFVKASVNQVNRDQDEKALNTFTKFELECLYDWMSKRGLSMNAYDGVRWCESTFFGKRSSKFFTKQFTIVLIFKALSIVDFDIYKTEDEWYYVKFMGDYYKCDQMSGVIDCLEYKIKDKVK